MTTINEQRELVSSFAFGAVKEALNKGMSKMQAISEAKFAVVSTFGLPCGRAALVCHHAYAQLEKLPYAGAISLTESSDRLLVIDLGLGVPKLSITLAEIMQMVARYEAYSALAELPVSETIH